MGYHRLASHPRESRNIPSRFMLQKSSTIKVIKVKPLNSNKVKSNDRPLISPRKDIIKVAWYQTKEINNFVCRMVRQDFYSSQSKAASRRSQDGL